MNHYRYAWLSLLAIVVLAGCSTPPPTAVQLPTNTPSQPTETPQPTVMQLPTHTPSQSTHTPPPATSSSTIDLQPFIEMAGQASCARDQNRLYVIDGDKVLWERRDLRCADASYEVVLFGASPDELLCRIGDSIAGPQLSCQDESLRPMFDTIIKHTGEADLGLGSDHTVEQIWQSK